ncbi:recombinase family protein [Mycobacterium sp. NPDC004974]
MKILAYLRVSTRDQLDAFGPERQREAIKAWAKREKHRIVGEVLEDISGTIAPFERDGWNEAVERCAGGEAAGVVVSDLSRLSRDQVRLELTIEQMTGGAAQLFSTSGEEQRMLDDPNDPQRKLIRTILAAINEYDRAMINVRLQAGRRIKKARGGYAGGQPPYGWTGDGKSMSLKPDPDEWPTLERIRELHKEKLSTRAIAAVLNGGAMFNRKGRPWTSASIARIVKREQTSGTNVEGAVA